MLGDPEFDGLRGEPRYRRLLKDLRLAKRSDVRTLPPNQQLRTPPILRAWRSDNSVCDDA